MLIKTLAGSQTHKCDRCRNFFMIHPNKPVEKHAPRFLVIERGRAITHRMDDTHEANGLSFCGSCSEIIMDVMGLEFPRF